MKNLSLAALLLVCFSVFNSASAQDYKTALGIRLSNNMPIVGNSISIKHCLNEKTAKEGMFSFGDPLALGALYEKPSPFMGTPGLQWYDGPGGYLGFGK